MKFRIIVSVLTISIIGLFICALLLALKLKDTNAKLNHSIQQYEAAGLKINNLENENSKALIEYANLLNDGTQDKWGIASGTNTLSAYSLFVENCNGEVEDCHEAELENALSKLLNSKGYVEFVETNGNKLYTAVNLALEGKYVKFKKSSNVRNGAIGIDNCGSASQTKIGTLLNGKIVKVLDECQSPGSQSVWAHIQYSK